MFPYQNSVYNPRLLHTCYVMRMEVVCGSEKFTAAGKQVEKELGILGVVKLIKRESNQALALY